MPAQQAPVTATNIRSLQFMLLLSENSGSGMNVTIPIPVMIPLATFPNPNYFSGSAQLPCSQAL